MIASPIDPLAPTPEGRLRYPPAGYSIHGEPCTCDGCHQSGDGCPEPCDGSCGCEACYDGHEEHPD